jgi:predicted nucleic acid-binding protein
VKGRPFFDTNVLIYAALTPADPRAEPARVLLGQGGLISVQVLNEFIHTARYKFRQPWNQVLETIADIRELCPTVTPLTVEVGEHGLAIAQRYGYHLWDALVIAAALEASCDTLYSEDMQDGQKIEGMRIRNPFRGQDEVL